MMGCNKYKGLIVLSLSLAVDGTSDTSTKRAEIIYNSIYIRIIWM